MSESERQDFEALAAGKRRSLAAEFIDFIKHNKKWWLVPLLVVIFLLAFLALFGGSAVAPFLYPLF